MPSWSSKVASIAKPSQEQQDNKSEDNTNGSRVSSAATKIQVGEHAGPMANKEAKGDNGEGGEKGAGDKKSDKKLGTKGDERSDKEVEGGGATSRIGGLFKRNKDKSKKKNGKDDNEQQQQQPFFLSGTSNAIAVRIKELDECCCADVPCISIVKEYCESRYHVQCINLYY